jgi:predicted PurR-regulated permease PerM
VNMTWWQRGLIWFALLSLASLVIQGVDPFAPIGLALVLIVAFEVVSRRLWPRRARKRTYPLA